MGFIRWLFEGSNDSDFVKVTEREKGSGRNRADVLIGSSETSNHCHLFVTDEGKVDVAHRGECDDCRK